MKKLAHILILLVACLVLAAPAAAQMDEWAMPAATTWEGHPPELVWGWSAQHGTLRPYYGGPAGSNTRATARTTIMNGQVLTIPAQKPAFSNSSGGVKLSVEPAATNLLTYSEAFDNAAWTKHAGCSVTANTGAAPDGATSADTLDNTGNVSDGAYRQVAMSDGAYTFSVWLRAATPHTVTIKIDTTPAQCSVTTTWQRFSVTQTIAAGNRFVSVYPGELGVAAGVVEVWGAQLEAGTVPTAYIPAVNPTSRAADAIQFDLPQAIKNTASVEEPTPTPVLTQTAGAIALATVAGGALAMPVDGSAADLSAYTGYVLKVTDSAGKTAWARIAAPGTGLALGSEFIANPTFDAGTGSWSGGDATISSVAGGQSNNCLEITRTGAQPRAYQNVAGLVQGNLYRLSAYNKQGTSGALEARVALLKSDGSTYEFYNSDTAPTDWAERVAYGTVTEATGARYVRLIQNDASAGTMLFDEASLTQVTSPPTTGVWLESTPGAGDKTWAYIQSGFNPNSISTWAVYPASQWRAEGTLVVKGVVFGVSKDDMVVGQNISFITYQDAAASVLYLYRGLTAASLYAQGTGANAYAAVTINQSSNTPYDFTVHWSSATNLMQVGYKLSSAFTWTWGPVGTFGGTFTLGSTLWIGYSPSYPFQIGSVTFYNRALTAAQLAWMDSLTEWVAVADDYYPARAVGGM